MSYKDDITPGAWSVFDGTVVRFPGVDSPDISIVCFGPFNEDGLYYKGVQGHSIAEAYANAQLIAEAGTVTNETGMTPYELSREAAHWKAEYYKLKQERDGALGALRDIAEGRAYQPVLHASSRLRQIEGGGDE